MPKAHVFEIDPVGDWLRQVSLIAGGTPSGSILVQSQNHGTVEWWTGLPSVSLAAGFTMQVVPPPPTVNPPTVTPGEVTWSAYGNPTWTVVPGGAPMNPGNLTFVGTNPGTPDVWYLQILWPTPISDGWLKWLRPANGAQRLLGSGAVMNWAMLGAPAVLNGYVSALDGIPRQ